MSRRRKSNLVVPDKLNTSNNNSTRSNYQTDTHYIDDEEQERFKPIGGMEKEPKDKQKKYEGFFETDPGETVVFTGMYKYVETDKFKEDGTKKIKRKRIFRKTYQSTKWITFDMKQEITAAFHMFDKDGSGSIDTVELRDAMKCLGIYLTKEETKQSIQKADKDLSGYVELDEFIPMMTEILEQRNQYDELGKTFIYYDNDDDGQITIQNLRESADLLDMEDQMNEANLDMMIEMADPAKKGYVNRKDYMRLMNELGLIPDDQYIEEADSDMENQARLMLANM